MVANNCNDFPSKVIAVVPAAGAGLRMGKQKAKQYLDLFEKPILATTLSCFQRCDLVDGVVLVVPEQHVGFCKKEIVEKYELNKVFKVVAGGKRRQDSVRRGIESIGNCCKWVLIHDGVRPLVTDKLIRRVINAARIDRAVITGIPVKDTVKRSDNRGKVKATIDRKGLWLIQTPQVFRWEDMHLAHKNAITEGWDDATDDASLAEKTGISVKIIDGEEFNIKITTPHDLDVARFFISKYGLHV